MNKPVNTNSRSIPGLAHKPRSRRVPGHLEGGLVNSLRVYMATVKQSTNLHQAGESPSAEFR